MQPASRSISWQWWVSGLLLLATMINYMDRQTLANLAPRITQQFGLNNEQYGDIEMVFGWAFAIGSLFFGIIADRVSIRALYPVILIAWSAVGFATGLADGYFSLLVCRILLGFFEAGHWPCALIVTQAVMSRGNRVMGNSILQSGASLGAVLTPIIIRLMVGDSTHPDAWRLPFFVIGGVGLLWAMAWLAVIRPGDLQRRPTDPLAAAAGEANPAPANANGAAANGAAANGAATVGATAAASMLRLLGDRRFWALAMMVVAINTSWQLVRAWLPKFLQEGRGYSEAEALYFNSTYFIFTDVGCIAAGLAALWLVRLGTGVHTSRVIVYLACSLLAALTTVAAVLPQGWLLLATLLCVAAGSLGVFPCYYSFTQEVTVTHMGRLTGMLSFIGWMASSPTHKLFGYVVDRTGSYDLNLAILGWAPLLGLLAFLVLWPRRDR